jgi:flagellar hook assembly protein FlgD
MFESNDPLFEWDGKNKKGNDVPEGTYYLILNGIFGDADVTRHYSLQLFRNK